jgi:hypothetical protein
MNRVTRLRVGPFAVVLVLVLLAYLAVHRRGVTEEEAEGEVVGTAVQVGDNAVRDKYAAVAVVGLVALFGFVTWAALRAPEGEDQAMPPAGESRAGDNTAVH